MSDRHLAAGSEPPPVKSKLLRLYSMKYCPFAQRTRLVLDYKNIPYETVNINLKEKPEWFVAKTPFAQVPVIEREGNIIYESAICNNWLDDVYPEPRLAASTPDGRAWQSIIMAHCDKVTACYYDFLRKNNVEDAKKRLEKEYAFLEQSLHAKFFGGDNPGLADFYVWPFMERFSIQILHDNGYPGLRSDQYPKLHQWVDDMKALPSVRKSYMEPEKHQKFAKSYLAGEPDYDPED